jgi:hypothetical protein
MIKGHVTVCKIYKDGTQEIVLDKANMITAGLGSSFLDIQQGQGSTYPSDYGPAYFQLGTGTPTFHAVATSSFIYQVCAPFDWEDYGEDTDLEVNELYRGFNASTVDNGVTYTELLETSAVLSSTIFSGTDQYFADITQGAVTKYFMDSFESQIVLDEKTANGKAITEVGLFAKNPKGLYQDSPLLIAYRSFAALNKTEEFSLVINWTIGFLGLSNNIDDHYTGSGGSGGRPPAGGISSANTYITR